MCAPTLSDIWESVAGVRLLFPLVLATTPALLVACSSLWGFDDLVVGDAGSDGSGDVDSAQAGDAAAPDGDADVLRQDSGGAGQDSGLPDARDDAQDSASQLADSGQDALQDGPCTPLTHSNGLGQTYQDCAPLGTYNATTAMEACVAAFGGSACTDHGPDCQSVSLVSSTYDGAYYYFWLYAVSGPISEQPGTVLRLIYGVRPCPAWQSTYATWN